jgi:uncharacterized protein YidB (DUF937 family)
MAASRPSVFDALATDAWSDDPLDQRLLAEVADRLAGIRDVNALQALLDDFRAIGCDADVRAWLAPGQSSAPPPLPVDAIDRVAALGHVFDRTWLDDVARRTGTDAQTVTPRLAALVPRAVKILTPRGDVPTPRALTIGLDGLRRKAAK